MGGGGGGGGVYLRGAFILKILKKGGGRLFERAFKRRGRLIEVIRYLCSPIMLHFRYFFTEIKTQTSSLILFGACQEKNFLKDDRHASHKDFLFIAIKKERQVFFTVVSKMKKICIL